MQITHFFWTAIKPGRVLIVGVNTAQIGAPIGQHTGQIIGHNVAKKMTVNTVNDGGVAIGNVSDSGLNVRKLAVRIDTLALK